LIVDDLLATGGSLGAASKLVKKTDGELLGGLVIMELSALNGRKQFDMPVHSFIKYDD
jgi:adenine phosphoribosyltransferase